MAGCWSAPTGIFVAAAGPLPGSPSWTAAGFQLVKALCGLRLLDRASRELDRLGALAPGDPDWRLWTGWVAFLGFDHGRAARYLEGPAGEAQSRMVESLESARTRGVTALVVALLLLAILWLAVRRLGEGWLLFGDTAA